MQTTIYSIYIYVYMIIYLYLHVFPSTTSVPTEEKEATVPVSLAIGLEDAIVEWKTDFSSA